MLKKMWYVYTVYEEKSFSKAAKRLFVSQPSLSAMVKKVESDYDITIFDRTTTPISLTPAITASSPTSTIQVASTITVTTLATYRSWMRSKGFISRASIWAR